MISVAMAAYNGENYIREQLDSILSQTVNDIEVIVCDDCSQDSTPNILREYEVKDSRVKVFFNEKNLGYPKNFEKAVSLCSGDYIALSDQDDIWYPEHLEILHNNIGNYDIISANASFIDKYSKPFPKSVFENMGDIRFNADSDALFYSSLYRGYIQGCASMMSRKLVAKAFPFPDGIIAKDPYLSCFAAAQGGGHVIKDKVLHYRQHSGSCTPQHKKTLFGNIKSELSRLGDKNSTVYWQKQRHLIIQSVLSYGGVNDKQKVMIQEALWWHDLPLCPKKIFFFIKNYKRMCLRNRCNLAFCRDLLRLMLQNIIF